MKRHFCLFFLLFILLNPSNNSCAQNSKTSNEIPHGSWEYWIQAIKIGGKGGLPGRPDGLAFTEALPVWVDCYFSHFLDQPLSKKNALMGKLVLRASSKLCTGSLSEWAE